MGLESKYAEALSLLKSGSKTFGREACLSHDINCTARFPFMELDDPVHNRNVPAFYIEYYNLPCSEGRISLTEEQNIPSVECRFHTSTQDHDNL